MIETSISEIQAKTVQSLYDRGIRLKDIRPEDQFAPWVLLGLKQLEEGEDLEASDVESFVRMGGTDHNDPTLRSMGK